MISPDLCPEQLRVPVPRAFRNSRGRRHWAMGAPRFVVDANSPAGLAARAASLLREQRGPLPNGLPAVAEASDDDRRSTTAAAAAGNNPDAVAAAGAGAAAAAAEGRSAGERRGTTAVAAVSRGRSRSRSRHGSIASSSSSSSRDSREVSADVSIAPAPPHPEENWRRQGDASGESDDGEERGDEGDEGLQGWTPGGRRGSLDPTLFSFWLAANLPLDDDARQELLMLDSVIMRLR